MIPCHFGIDSHQSGIDLYQIVWIHACSNLYILTDVEDVPDLLDPVHDNIFMSGPGDQPNSSAESDHSGQIGETWKNDIIQK